MRSRPVPYAHPTHPDRDAILRYIFIFSATRDSDEFDVYCWYERPWRRGTAKQRRSVAKRGIRWQVGRARRWRRKQRRRWRRRQGRQFIIPHTRFYTPMILDLPVCAEPPPQPNIIIVLHVLVIPNTGPLARCIRSEKPLRVGYYGAAGSTDKDGNGWRAGGSGHVGGHAGHVVSNGVTEASSTVFNTAVTQPPKTDNEH